MKIPDSKTEQYNYKNSFFVRTVADWNKLEDTVVTLTADSVTAFLSAVGRGLPPTHRQSEQKCVLASF